MMKKNEERVGQTEKGIEQKKSYETPKLTEHGKITELTRGTGVSLVDTLGLSP